MRAPSAALPVRVARLGERAVAVDLDERVQTLVEVGNTVEVRGHDLVRGNRAAREQPRELGQGLPNEIGFHFLAAPCFFPPPLPVDRGAQA